MLTNNQQALNRYNRLFNNQGYEAIAEHLAADLDADRQSDRVADVMNCLTDTALSLCGNNNQTEAWLKLATFCGQNRVRVVTIDLIARYLLVYQQPADTRVNDFELTAKALLKAYETADPLRAAVSWANGVHGWRGRMAYDLLAASDYLVQAAVQLLMHGDPFYIHEKLQTGLRRITCALYEGVRHSERSDLFDFSETEIPSQQDRL